MHWLYSFLSLTRPFARSFALTLSRFAFVCFHSIIIELFRIVCYELYIHLLFNQIKMIRIKMPNRSHCKINCRMLRATENVQIFQCCCCFLTFSTENENTKSERFRCLRAKEYKDWVSHPASKRMDNTHPKEYWKFSYHLFFAVSSRSCFSFSFFFGE